MSEPKPSLAIRLLQLLDERVSVPGWIKRRIEKYSVASKINFIILTAVLPMLFVLSMIFLLLFFQISNQIEATLVQKMVSTKNAYNFYERTTLVYARILSENMYIKKELLADTINVGPILRVCRQVQSSVSLNRITIYDRKGVVVVRSHKPSEFGEDESKVPAIENALKKGETTAALALEKDQVVLQNTVPVYFDDDRIGAITAGYVLDHQFARTLSDLTQSGIFIGAGGKLVAASYAGDLEKITDTNYAATNRTYSISRRVTFKDRNGSEQSDTMDFRFVPIATPTAADVQNAGIAVALKPSYPRFLLYTLFWGAFALILLVIFLGVLLSFKIGYRIAGYASAVSEAMTRFSAGDLKTRVDGVSDDELGRVARGFNEMAAELERRIQYIRDTNENLETIISERTQDLGVALNHVTQLEEMQQGDYLLMSLLLNPLTASELKIGKLQASFYMEQKKKFNFKGQSGEIGGDYTLFAPLLFKGTKTKWLFFFNGDAMGKSSQGAAGALICGVTLQSILARYKSESASVKPETWLRSVYRELDHIFTLFKGSMNMSAILGLTNTARGETYYINAEHPRLVLFRKGRARFVEDAQRTPKLGSTTGNKTARVHYVHMKPGDMLFAGSDGKDDLEIAGSIESDDERFVKIVEAARGDLNKIRAEIDKAGARTDDLSLVRISLG
ncbi:SpoIIE family protein phosphatase [Turneriella parva]|uniref:Stage II sporulation protein E n=1 Tax=Turneriella parva (strain ATCC BAA-1111 / DSM 21527 / NCTC 11395 / H) TaxID=869212 RepID=I4B2T0_TURPD|nr:SpoIIE family protein phosphatase [Turneriella parva]AFM11587.1 Stage II sporulation protein E [Turneriella parva DSM 21527]